MGPHHHHLPLTHWLVLSCARISSLSPKAWVDDLFFQLDFCQCVLCDFHPLFLPPHSASHWSHSIAGLAHTAAKDGFELLTLMTSFPTTGIKTECHCARLSNLMLTLLFILSETPYPWVTDTTMCSHNLLCDTHARKANQAHLSPPLFPS